MNHEIKILFDNSFDIETISATPEVSNCISLQDGFKLTVNSFKLSCNDLKKNQDYTFKITLKNKLTKNDFLREFLQLKLSERFKNVDLSKFDNFIEYKIDSMSTVILIQNDIMNYLLTIRKDILTTIDLDQMVKEQKFFEDVYFEKVKDIK